MRLPLLLSLAASLCAADYYVSPSGSDSAAGTSSAAPWKTVAKVNGRNLAAGDRVFFQGGATFTDAGLQLRSGDGGTASNPVVIGSYGTGRATLQPPSSQHAVDLYNVGGFTLRDLVLIGPGRTPSDSAQKRGVFAYCDLAGGVKLAATRLENLEVSGFYEGVTLGAWHSSFSGWQEFTVSACLVRDNCANGITTYGYQPGSATQQSHDLIQVLGTEARGNLGDPTLSNPASQHSGSGIIISGGKAALVDRCYAHHNGGGAGDNSGGGPVGIWGYSTNGLVIQRSLVHDQKTTHGAVDGGGFDLDGGCTNSVIQYCYAYGNEGPGYLICEYSGATPLQNATLRYSISWRNGTKNGMGGIHFYNGENLASELQGVRIHNNLIYGDNSLSGPCVNYQSGPIADVRFHDNIFVVKGGEQFVKIGSNTAAFRFQGNLYWAADGSYAGGWRWGATTYTSLAAWRAASGSPETLSGAPVGLQADPLLAELLAPVQPTSVAAMEAMTSFRQLAGSPCRDAGLDLRRADLGAWDPGVRDFFGGAIPQGAGFDLGVQEADPVAGNQPPVLSAASANPSPVSGTSTALTATATDDGGEAALVYAWSATALPSGGTVTFSPNGTNGAKAATATFTRAGSYGLQVVATDAGGLSATRALTVTVNQTLGAIVVSPATVTVSLGGTKQFTAAGRDQFNQSMSAGTVSWSLATGSVGTVSSGGLYTAPASAGSATVRATAGGKTGTAAVTVSAAGLLNLSVNKVAVNEGAGTASLTVTRSSGSAGAVSVQWATSTSGANATAGSDYTAASGTLSWADGESAAKTISVAILNDTAVEPSEVFRVLIKTPGGGALLGATTTAYVSILDNDAIALAAPWTSQDVGSVLATGSASQTAGGLITVAGSGADIWNQADGFRFASQSISGDFDLVARVDAQRNTNTWAKAGLMVRASTAAGSVHGFCLVTPGNGTSLTWRSSTGGSSSSVAGPTVAAPTWLKLTRRGGTVAGYQSGDGLAWTLISSKAITLPSPALVGLAVSSHADGQLSVADFSQVQLSPVASN